MRRLSILLALATVVALFWLTEPLPQDPAYHDFADTRAFAGIPNALNVLSNLPFLLFGAWGLRLAGGQRLASDVPTCWWVFFLGIFLTGLGSGWYHLAPDNASLAWDRLPMTIGFAGFVAALIGEYVDAGLARRLLVPLLFVGIASVVWWVYSESQGRGDLRPYALVALLPLPAIPILLIWKGREHDLSGLLWIVVASYVAAKLFEFFDREVFAMGLAVSGHSLKHLAAAIAPALILYGLARRSHSAAAPGDLAH
ncbi:MAG: hypothetical protein QNJ07_11140 [Woeseiaceae bacterium]|nr:hypothetical protein [Woeseiaceae bacterium]